MLGGAAACHGRDPCPGRHDFGQAPAGPLGWQPHLDETEGARRGGPPPGALGGDEPSQQLIGRPRDARHGREAEAPEALGPPQVANPRHHLGHVMALAGDPGGQDLRVVAARHGRPGTGPRGARLFEVFPVEAEAGHRRPPPGGGQAAGALGFLTIRKTSCPAPSRPTASPEPTRQQPTMMTCTGSYFRAGGSSTTPAVFAAALAQAKMTGCDGRRAGAACRPRARSASPSRSATGSSGAPRGAAHDRAPVRREALEGPRLGALSPGMISSSAYATAEMLNQLVPVIGVAALSLIFAGHLRHLAGALCLFRHPLLRVSSSSPSRGGAATLGWSRGPSSRPRGSSERKRDARSTRSSRSSARPGRPSRTRSRGLRAENSW